MTNHGHDYYHDDCVLCQDEKQDALSAREDAIEFKRRCAVLSIPEDDLIDILNEVDYGIPDGGVVTGCYHDVIKGTFEIKVCNKSYHIVGLNQVIPKVERL